MVVQKDSEATKVKDLLARIAELERIVGQKQLAIDFQEKLIREPLFLSFSSSSFSHSAK